MERTSGEHTPRRVSSPQRYPNGADGEGGVGGAGGRREEGVRGEEEYTVATVQRAAKACERGQARERAWERGTTDQARATG